MPTLEQSEYAIAPVAPTAAAAVCVSGRRRTAGLSPEAAVAFRQIVGTPAEPAEALVQGLERVRRWKAKQGKKG